MRIHFFCWNEVWESKTLALSAYFGIQQTSQCQLSTLGTNVIPQRLHACHKTFWAYRCITIPLPLHAIHEVDLLASCFCVWYIAWASEYLSPSIGAYNLQLPGFTLHLVLKLFCSTRCSPDTPYAPRAFLRRSLHNHPYSAGFHRFGKHPEMEL